MAGIVIIMRHSIILSMLRTKAGSGKISEKVSQNPHSEYKKNRLKQDKHFVLVDSLFIIFNKTIYYMPQPLAIFIPLSNPDYQKNVLELRWGQSKKDFESLPLILPPFRSQNIHRESTDHSG